MKILLYLIFSIVIWGCGQNTKNVNHFTSLNDTLVLKTEKVMGYGMLSYSAAYEINFQDSTENYDFPMLLPKNLSNIKIANELVDFKPYWYGNLKKSSSEYLTTFLKDYFPQKIDTSNIPAIKDNSISVMSGMRGQEKIFIVDENNNKDFRDDSVRVFQKMDFISLSNLIKCKYNIYDGSNLTKDSGWVNIGTNGNDKLLFSVSQHLESTFSFDEQTYKIEAVNGAPFLRFCYENPLLTIVSQNGIKKDSVLKSEIIEKDEYLKLGDCYFRFANISNDGKLITLVQERDVSNKIGTQIGFIAPSFEAQTIDEDSISSKDYIGKYLLLSNVTACWSQKMSYEYFKELTEKYASKLCIIGIDNSPVFLEQNIKDLNLRGKFMIAETNPSIQKNYRQDFCSRTCFLIDPNGRIADKFEINEWKEVLSKYFK